MSKSSYCSWLRQTESLENFPNSARGVEQMAEVMVQIAEMIKTNQQIKQQKIRMADRSWDDPNLNPKVKLQREEDNMETFLETFEASMKVTK